MLLPLIIPWTSAKENQRRIKDFDKHSQIQYEEIQKGTLFMSWDIMKAHGAATTLMIGVWLIGITVAVLAKCLQDELAVAICYIALPAAAGIVIMFSVGTLLESPGHRFDAGGFALLVMGMLCIYGALMLTTARSRVRRIPAMCIVEAVLGGMVVILQLVRLIKGTDARAGS